MSLTIHLPSDTEAALQERAAAAGQRLDAYVEGLLQKELGAPLSLGLAAEPLARAVESSGLSEDEFTATLLDARQAARAARRRDPA